MDEFHKLSKSDLQSNSDLSLLSSRTRVWLMKELIPYAITVFVSYFAMMNPIANTPIFLSLTQGSSKAEQRLIAIKSTSLAFIIISIVCLIGQQIFHMFGITLPALRIAGGILVFLIGREMLTGSSTEIHTPSKSDNTKSRQDSNLSIAISPLAVPILGGPGTIATAMNFSIGKTLMETFISITAFGLLCGLTCLFFLTGERFVDYIGESAIKVISRMMGLILTVIGVQLFLEGVHGATKLQFHG